MTTTIDLTLFNLGGIGRRDLSFTINGWFHAGDALAEPAPAACFDGLDLPRETAGRTIGDVVSDWLPAGWACIPFASATDGGGFPYASCAELFRGRPSGRPRQEGGVIRDTFESSENYGAGMRAAVGRRVRTLLSATEAGSPSRVDAACIDDYADGRKRYVWYATDGRQGVATVTPDAQDRFGAGSRIAVEARA